MLNTRKRQRPIPSVDLVDNNSSSDEDDVNVEKENRRLQLLHLKYRKISAQYRINIQRLNIEHSERMLLAEFKADKDSEVQDYREKFEEFRIRFNKEMSAARDHYEMGGKNYGFVHLSNYLTTHVLMELPLNTRTHYQNKPIVHFMRTCINLLGGNFDSNSPIELSSYLVDLLKTDGQTKKLLNLITSTRF